MTQRGRGWLGALTGPPIRAKHEKCKRHSLRTYNKHYNVGQTPHQVRLHYLMGGVQFY